MLSKALNTLSSSGFPAFVAILSLLPHSFLSNRAFLQNRSSLPVVTCWLMFCLISTPNLKVSHAPYCPYRYGRMTAAIGLHWVVAGTSSPVLRKCPTSLFRSRQALAPSSGTTPCTRWDRPAGNTLAPSANSAAPRTHLNLVKLFATNGLQGRAPSGISLGHEELVGVHTSRIREIFG